MKHGITFSTIFELGQRPCQEDCIYPAAGNDCSDEGLFIVCDGMGGHDKGEVASQAVCRTMSEWVHEHTSVHGSFSEEDFKSALSAAYDMLDALDDGAVRKMGTTMTFMKFHKGGCLTAHIGDSRIYHIRPSAPAGTRILHVTRDHSLVNDLVAIGEMTPEEARTSKQRNVITRAMQPHQERRARADIRNIDDIRPGDFFYMCTDGMLEQMLDDDIETILCDGSTSVSEKTALLIEQTKNNRDNHSAVLVYVSQPDARQIDDLPYVRLWILAGVMFLISVINFYLAMTM